MAVFYKWIKGCNAGASTDNGLWTYLEWGSGTEGSAGSTVNNLPHIYTYAGKQDSPETENDLGYILTNKATDISLESDWKFNSNKGLSFYDNSTTPVEQSKFYSNTSTFYLLTRDWTINDFQTEVTGGYKTMAHFYGGASGKIELYYPVDIGGASAGCRIVVPTNAEADSKTIEMYAEKVALYSQLDVGWNGEKSTITIPAMSSGGSVVICKPVEVKDNPVHAQYFNATSDKRAKENIKPADYNALELIQKLPVYIYNYKNQEETVTGILAQDLLEAQPEGLDLVSNINATGENGDYMSIKNDKLMFVLIKAIQEQQQQINTLKAEIEQLKQA